MAKYQERSVAVVSTMRDITVETFNVIGKMDKANSKLSATLDVKLKAIAAKKAVTKEDLHEAELLRKAVETLAAGKVQLAVKNYDLIDQNIKIVDHEIALLEKALIENGETFPMDEQTTMMITWTADRAGASGKKRKSDKAGIGEPVAHPNEPVYCICNRIAFGDMIACDNEDCVVEWYHYPCVNLTRKPRNKWVCPTCAHNRRK